MSSSCELNTSHEEDLELGNINPVFSVDRLNLSSDSAEGHSDRISFSSKTRYANILTADDSALNLMGLKSQLNKISPSSTIDEALNGEDAVELFQKRLEICVESNWLVKPYRVVLIDYNMPICDGPRAIKRIRQMCLDLKSGDIQILKDG